MIICRLVGLFFSIDTFATEPRALPQLTREQIRAQVELQIETMRLSGWKPADVERALGPRGWDQCNPVYEAHKQRGLMNDEEIAIWRSAFAVPQFTPSGIFFGVLMQCGCFHPGSLIQVMHLDSGVMSSIMASEVRERSHEVALVHLSSQARPDFFAKTFSPIRITTHGKEMFDLVVINASNGKSLRVTRNHGILGAVWYFTRCAIQKNEQK